MGSKISLIGVVQIYGAISLTTNCIGQILPSPNCSWNLVIILSNWEINTSCICGCKWASGSSMKIICPLGGNNWDWNSIKNS